MSDNKYKAVLIIMITMMLIVLIGTISFINIEDTPPFFPPDIEEISTHYYELAIDINTGNARLFDDFVPENAPKKRFHHTGFDDKKIGIDSDWNITLKAGAKVRDKFTITTKSGNIVYAITDITIVSADEIISSANDFLLLNNSAKTVIINNTLDFSSIEGNINAFKGKIYFNHNEIINLSNDNYPLFNELENATISGLVIKNIDVIITDDNMVTTNVSNTVESFGSVFGLIAGKSFNTNINNIQLNGKVKITLENSNARYYIGGLIGFANDKRRQHGFDGSISKIENISTALDFQITTQEESLDYIEFGAMVARITNASINNALSGGLVDFLLEGKVVNDLRIGGIFARLEKEYESDPFGYDFNFFDEINNLNSNIVIFIELDEIKHNKFYGAIGAILYNVNVSNCGYDVLMYSRIGRNVTKANRLKIIAKAYNNFSGNFDMTINGESWDEFS